MKTTPWSKIGFVFGTALLGALTGCVAHSEGRHHARVYAQPAPAYVHSGVMVQYPYTYYPAYQVYYSSHRGQYVYREGRSWVSRPMPPRVSVDVLVASPSVRLDFHDAPAVHHATVVRQYPKHWAPPGANSNHGHGKGNKDKGNGKDHEDRR